MNKLEYPFIYKNYKVELVENWNLIIDNGPARDNFDIIYNELIGHEKKGFWYNITNDLFRLYIL